MEQPSRPAYISHGLHEIGRRVRAARVEAGLSQEGFADLCGFHRTYIGQVERGGVNLTVSSVLRLAAALQVDPGVFVAGLSTSDPTA